MPNYCSNKCCSPSRAVSGPYGLLYPWATVRTVCSRSQVTACGWWSLFVVFLQLRLGRWVGFLGWTERVWEVTGGPEKAVQDFWSLLGLSQGAPWAVVPPGPIYFGPPNTSIGPGEENTAAIFSSLWGRCESTKAVQAVLYPTPFTYPLHAQVTRDSSTPTWRWVLRRGRWPLHFPLEFCSWHGNWDLTRCAQRPYLWFSPATLCGHQTGLLPDTCIRANSTGNTSPSSLLSYFL